VEPVNMEKECMEKKKKGKFSSNVNEHGDKKVDENNTHQTIFVSITNQNYLNHDNSL
jgi:hypothetical protein